MTAVVFYFQVHQPFRLRRYSIFDSEPVYFDDARNEEILRKVADKCYRPGARLLLDLTRKHQGTFRFAFSFSGTVLEQLERWAPDVLQLFQDVVAAGSCELLAETSHHSLAFLYSKPEFLEQVSLHAERLRTLFSITPTVFRNTELIYSNDLAGVLASLADAHARPRFAGCLAEGSDFHLGYRSPAFPYAPAMRPTGRDARPFALLLRNYRLSDDIAFRFSNHAWAEFPLTPAKFAGWVHGVGGPLCNLFMDFETFGEHQWADTGIFEFLAGLPEAILRQRDRFLTPSQALAEFPPSADFDAPTPMSWADSERDLTAWRGNAMQNGALDELYRLETPIKDRLARATDSRREPDIADARRLLADWRCLTTSDHFYYMCTKYFADGEVHKYFNPYDSPYDSYINYMNVLDNLRTRLAR